MSNIICYNSNEEILSYYTQWDVNQKIIIKGADISSAPDFHFLNNIISDVFIVKSNISNDSIVANVPDEILQYDVPVIVHICYKDGTTEHTIRVPVMPRKKPENYIYTESSSGDLSGAVVAVVNNLTTNNAKAALSAAQGVVIRSKLEEINAEIDNFVSDDEVNLAISNALKDFEGEPGEDGATFIPSVDAFGNLSWSNNKNLANPEIVNIMGPSGNDGNPGRGIVSVLRTSGTGAAGSTDIYTITYSDNTTSIFSVYNGANGKDVPYESGSGESGKDGATFTPYVDNSGNLSWSNDKGLDNPETVNIRGPKGDPGETGANGADGMSATHVWNGEVLTITSASGTSSANLKGDKGDDGVPGYSPIRGVDYWTQSDVEEIRGYIENAIETNHGENGQDGFSPTISVDESDGGHLITIIDINGSKTLFVPNGKDGSDGAQGQRGDTGLPGEKGDPGERGVGITNIKQTITSNIDSGVNVITATLSDGQEYTFNVKNGSKGSAGSDGTSCTHSWDGTTLNVTSASGTSSSNLVGPKGDKGDPGSNGANGVSVTSIKQTTTSSDSGGTNKITATLSDGTTSVFSIKNGSAGTNGTNGVGISSVKQTTTSTESGGTNVVTVTLSDGTTSTFNVKNGTKGNTGDTGRSATINGVNTLTLNTGAGLVSSQSGNTMTISANYDYGTTDLVAGSSSLTTGKLYFVYE